MTIPQMLKRYRRSRKNGRGEITQAEAAKFFGIPLGTYQQWESGRRNPNPFTLAAIAAKLKARRR